MDGNRRGRQRRRGAILLLPVLLLLVAVGGCGGGATSSGGETGFVSGQALTRFPPADRAPAPVITGPAVDGPGTVTTGGRTGKVVVINVWGSWCAPCRLEAPDLAAASRDTADVADFVGLNIRDARPDTARAFLRSFSVPYPHIFDPDGEQLLRFAGTVPPNGIPTTLIVDREGRIAARVVGVVSRNTLVEMIDEIAAGR